MKTFLNKILPTSLAVILVATSAFLWQGILTVFGTGGSSDCQGLPISSFTICDGSVTIQNGTLAIGPQVAAPVTSSGHNGFSFERSITVNTGQATTTETNFPMLVSGTYAYLKTTGNGGKVQNANGYDVGFYTNSDCSTGKMNWETEKYVASTGEVDYWVKNASLADGTKFWMCYGNASISTDQSNKTAVWDSNYKAVYHLPDGSSLSPNDSTSGGFGNGTTNGATATSGQVDGAGSFVAASSQYIDLANTGTHLNSARTVEAWVNVTATTGNEQAIVEKGYNSAGDTVEFRLSMLNSGHLVWAAYHTAYQGISSSTNTLSTGTWYHIVGTWDGTTWLLYVNGSQDATTATNSNSYSDSSNYAIGADETSGLGTVEFFNGKIDEVRISNTARTSHWISTEYNNQSNPSAFYTVGAEQ